jgi:hypothetical protein
MIMPKRSKDADRGGGKKHFMISPQWASKRKSPSYLLRQALTEVVGKPFDREPCPHTMTSWDEIGDPQQPDDPHRRRARKILTPCTRPAGHVRAQKFGTAPDPQHPGDPHYTITVIVPDTEARVHADAAGRTWA